MRSNNQYFINVLTRGIPLSDAISNYSIVLGTSYVVKQDLLNSLVC
jgi:hypothetical protein